MNDEQKNRTVDASLLSAKLDAVKKAAGIERANCESCKWLGQDNDGNDPELSVAWDICEKHKKYSNYKTFPFYKEMPCWEPEFWHSKYAGEIKTGEHEEVMELLKEFMSAITAANLNSTTPDVATKHRDVG